MIIIIKYRGTYRIFMPIDNNGNTTSNNDDTYLKCKNAEIYRYNANTLVVYFFSDNSNQFANNRIEELKENGVNLTLFQYGQFERTFKFLENQLNIVANILKPVTRGANKSPKVNKNKKKREYTQEQLEVLRERLQRIRENKSANKNEN